MVPLATFILQLRERGIKMLEAMQKVDKITPFTFRAFESVVVPEDFETIYGKMDPELARPSGSRLRTVIADVLRNRYYRWIIMHPGLTNSHVHPSRRMSPTAGVAPPSCCGTGDFLFCWHPTHATLASQLTPYLWGPRVTLSCRQWVAKHPG